MNNKKWSIEKIKPISGFDIKCALFDFDGTVSLIREGWQDVMIPYFIEVLQATRTSETHEQIANCVRDFVDTLTGKQTIFQCMQLNDEVVLRGGKAVDPIEYKHEYLRRLELRIKERKEDLQSGLNSENYLVPKAKEFIACLKNKGIKCYLASGTDENDVLFEAKLLGLENAFEGGIHGAHDYMLDCSKEMVIHAMIEKEGIKPSELISFGDGYVEVELVALLGGLAVGVATDEKNKAGVDEWKRNRLISAGAHAIIPDFKEYDSLIKFIMESK